ncbi:MAG: Sec-independent protein translocase protein TatB [Chromatiales bacterium]|jgi:sec-independent protein translocase protein TatB
MFDVGFWELLIIGLVALLVIGPERLPGVARTTGAWLGRAKRFVTSVKSEIDEELRTEELKRILKEQNLSNPSHSILEETKKEFSEIQKEVEQAFEERAPSSNKPENKSD